MGRGKAQKTITLENQLINIVDVDLRDYWSLTVRQVYYQMVKNLFMPNSINSYRKVSKLLANLRQEHRLSWESIQDKSRRLVEKRGVENVNIFIKKVCKTFLRNYSRCLVQQQENYVELWTEKDALASIFEDVAWAYCVRVVTCKGQLSRTFLNGYAERASAAIDRGLQPVILHGGDLDPSGIAIPRSVKNKLKEFYGINIILDRFALTPEQIERYSLPVDFKAAKKKDPNFKRFVSQFGTLAVELDALHPEDLKTVILEALRRWLDVDSMLEEQELQKEERDYLYSLRREILPIFRSHGHDV